MPGRNSGDNKLGLTPFIVGKVTGDGCLFGGPTGIQDAIDACFAAGGGVVAIRPDPTPYVENLILRESVDLIGFSVDGRLPSFIGSRLQINGNHTWAIPAGFNTLLIRDITFLAAAGDLFTVTNPNAGSAGIIACKECSLEATGAGGRVWVLDASDPTATVQISMDLCQLFADGDAIAHIGAGNHATNLIGGTVNSSTASAVNMASGNCQFDANNGATLNGNTFMANMASAGNNQVNLFDCQLFAPDECLSMTGGTNNAFVSGCTLSSGAVSTFWAAGTGTVQYSNISLLGSALDVDPVITSLKQNWQPYGEVAPAAVGSNRGTSSYNSAHFTVTDGFVELVAPATPFAWVDRFLDAVVSSNEGNFTFAVVNLTMPAAPANGDVVKFKQITNDNINIIANAGQFLQVGNLGGTNVATTASGDALEFTWTATGAIWVCNAIIGNVVIT